MVLNKFNLFVLLQIVGIAGVGMLLTISLGREYLHMTSAGLLLLWLGQILFLYFYLGRIHRDVYKFMEALKNQNTAQRFNRQNPGRYFEKLYAMFNEITGNFRLVRIEKEAENQFFRETIRQSASGILALKEDGSFTLANDAALRLLGMIELSRLPELAGTHPDLAALLGEEEPLDGQVKLLVGRKQVQVAVKAKEMNLQGSRVRIFSLLDISNEMAGSEVEAWQKLIRVLNHEITNSITPIHMLSTSLLDLFQQAGQQISPGKVDKQMIDRLVLGIKTLVKRSGGLADFLNTYKSFTQTGEPDYSRIRLEELFTRIHSLMADALEKSSIHLEMEVSPAGLELLADEKLIEQSLINLVKNAIYARREVDDASIRLRAFTHERQVHMEVWDNGKGIPEAIRDKLFQPNFTTKSGGMGMGLAISYNIIRSLGGRIWYETILDVGTTFFIELPCSIEKS